MKIKQFEYKPLSHFSYAIVSNGKMALVDPERDPIQYYKFAEENNAEIIAVFETHPHADFVSSHLQIHKETGATIYASKKIGAEYPHKAFDDGNSVQMGNVTFTALNTPGHSPDSITVIATENKKTALFTGDFLFVGDVGRPDLRESVGHMKAKREELAKSMFDSITNKLSSLPDDAIVYPAHGAGSLCGKGMSADHTTSTLGNERMGNWAFKKQTEAQFVAYLLDSQPFIPHYFGFNVDINKNGAKNLQKNLGKIPFHLFSRKTMGNSIIVDIRNEVDFKKNHLPGSFNIQAVSDTAKFETWLGSTVRPNEKFYLVVDTVENAYKISNRIAKIGYETQVKGILTLKEGIGTTSENLNFKDFKEYQEKYTIVDIRNDSEVAEGKLFKNALTIPLYELREKATQIPTNKPIVVHCAAGYRSAAGSSILERELQGAIVFDLGEKIQEFK